MTLQDFGEGKDSECFTFIGIKAKHWQMEPHKIKLLYTNKTISQVKKKPTKWDRIFANYTSFTRLTHRIYKELRNQKFNKTTQFLYTQVSVAFNCFFLQ